MHRLLTAELARTSRYGSPIHDAITRGVYDLAALARQAGVRRKTVEIRPIHITAAIEQELYAVTRQPVDTWAAQVKTVILPAYERAVSELITDAPADDVGRAFTQAEAAGVATVAGLTPEVQEWLVRVVGWHTRQWSARVKAALGVDIFPYINVAENQDYIDAMLRRITSLITSINDDLRRDIAEVVWREFQSRTPPRKVASMISARLGIGRRRALLIASDQASKVSSELTMLRQAQAGIKRYRWDATMDGRTRPLHAALNGSVRRWDRPHPTERHPGYPVRCRCSAGAVLDLDED